MLSNQWFLDSNNKYYWLESSGSMASNTWKYINNIWYRFDKSGAMLSNQWFLDSNNEYYWLKSDGSIASNESLQIDNSFFTFNSNGIIIKINYYDKK